MNPLNVIRILLENAEQEFGQISETVISEEEEELAKQLLFTIKAYLVKDVSADGLVKVEHEYEDSGDIDDQVENYPNFFAPNDDDHSSNEEQEGDQDSEKYIPEEKGPSTRKRKMTVEESTSTEEEYDSDYNFEEDEAQSTKKRTPTMIQLEYAKRVVATFDKYGFKRVQTRFCRIRNYNQIHRCRKIIENAGTKYEKLQKLNGEVLKKFTAAKERNEYVNTKQFQSWGNEIAKELNVSGFKGSEKWALNFKKKFGLVQDNMPKGTGSRGPRPSRDPGCKPKPRKPRKKKTETDNDTQRNLNRSGEAMKATEISMRNCENENVRIGPDTNKSSSTVLETGFQRQVQMSQEPGPTPIKQLRIPDSVLGFSLPTTSSTSTIPPDIWSHLYPSESFPCEAAPLVPMMIPGERIPSYGGGLEGLNTNNLQGSLQQPQPANFNFSHLQ